MERTAEVGSEEWARNITRPHTGRYGRNVPHDPAYCCASVHEQGGMGFYQCSRKPKVNYGGLGYCGQHDPASVSAKRNKRNAEFNAKWAAQKQAQADAEAKRKLLDDALDAIRQIAAGHNNPRTLAAQVLAQEARP
jgi:hypothetical protein